LLLFNPQQCQFFLYLVIQPDETGESDDNFEPTSEKVHLALGEEEDLFLLSDSNNAQLLDQLEPSKLQNWPDDFIISRFTFEII
jgi:hypothetical protein